MQKAQYSVVFKERIKEFKKSIDVDSDKSLSIRSILFGAIAEGVSEVKNLLESDDVISTITFIKKRRQINSRNCLKAFGKNIRS